ncbi:MAG: hypothetical protein ACR2P2_07470 [Nakamurella sp.]
MTPITQPEGVLVHAPALTTPSVQLLADLDSVDAALLELATSTKHETLSALADPNVSVQAMRTSWDRDVGSLARGVDGRIIYPAQAARRPDVMEYLTEFAARGAKVRVLGTVPNRMVIADRARALIPESPGHPSGRGLLISGTVLVRALYTEFREMWRASLPVGAGPEDTLSWDGVQAILTVLESGVTDGVAAQRLGVSERTMRRRVSAVMELLGATSRFDAGVKAARAGWL